MIERNGGMPPHPHQIVSADQLQNDMMVEKVRPAERPGEAPRISLYTVVAVGKRVHKIAGFMGEVMNDDPNAIVVSTTLADGAHTRATLWLPSVNIPPNPHRSNIAPYLRPAVRGRPHRFDRSHK
jgi:hypothetical protein